MNYFLLFKRKINLKYFFFLSLFFLLNFNIFGQGQSDFHEAAKQAYLKAAAETRCPERVRYFKAKADYCECNIKKLRENPSKVCFDSETGPIPDCSADAMEGGVGNQASGTNSSKSGSSAKSAAATAVETDAAISTMFSVVDQAKANGKTNAGAMLAGTISGASKISDFQSQTIFLGVGGVATLLTHISENATERKKRELEIKTAANLRSKIINDRKTFFENRIKEGKVPKGSAGISKIYTYFVSQVGDFSPEHFDVYITEIIEIRCFSDGTWPYSQDIMEKFKSSTIPEIRRNQNKSLFTGTFNTPEEAFENAKTIVKSLESLGANLKVYTYTFPKNQSNINEKFWNDN